MIVPEKVRAWWSAMQGPRTLFELQWDDAGLALVPVPSKGEVPLRLAWNEISEAYTYKRDCVTVDQIRLILGDDTHQTWLEVSEDDVGFRALIAALPHHLPGFPAAYEWWDRVAQPAFEPQWTQIYRRTVAPV